MTTALATGADERYGHWLLNMLGSVQRNSPGVFDRVVAYDLGLAPDQRRLLDRVRGVEVDEVPPVVPHWREGRTWKAWVWTHLEADELVWLDAGLTVLRPLDGIVEAIRRDGYFVVSQGVRNRESIPADYLELYGIGDDAADAVAIAAGILGFRTSGPFYERVIVPTYEDCLAGRSVGFSAGDAGRLNRGLDATEEPLLRDCPAFRWDQTILNIHLRLAVRDPVVHDLDEYAGWRSPRDHPRQVIWSHRRRGDYAYLPWIRYRGPLALAHRAWGLAFRARWWAVNHRWLFRPGTYVRKARALVGATHAR